MIQLVVSTNKYVKCVCPQQVVRATHLYRSCQSCLRCRSLNLARRPELRRNSKYQTS